MIGNGDSKSNRGVLPRRTFLQGMAAGALPLSLVSPVGSLATEPEIERNASPRPHVGLIARQTQPDNLEFYFPSLTSAITPNEQFFVRNHFDVPAIRASEWRLSVAGTVGNKLSLSYDDLRNMKPVTVTALLECSGNGRVFLKPPQMGIRWEQGAVGNAEWTGVPLAEILKRAGVAQQSIEVVLEGADKGTIRSPLPATPGEIHFARSLPLEKALAPNVLLAYKMNGKDLAPNHGYPLRAIVPGWYGMASVKWLKRIYVTDRPFQGYFQTFSYTYWKRRGGMPDLVPVTEMEIKAQIARPVMFETVPAGRVFRVFGAAWAGEAGVAKVDISTDGGASWAAARLLDKPVQHAWRLWTYQWRTPQRPGRYVLMARGTDDDGREQPLTRDPDRRDTMITHVQRIEVMVQ